MAAIDVIGNLIALGGSLLLGIALMLPGRASARIDQQRKDLS